MRGLVSPRISQNCSNGFFEMYPRSVRLRSRSVRSHQSPPPVRTEINYFSENSRRRLRFVALNAWPQLISQYCMTYHLDFPHDGKVLKRHLNRFLDNIRKNLDCSAYLWVLEFQKRGAPHFHLFLPWVPSVELQRKLTHYWLLASEQSNDNQSLAFHNHPRNFKSWDMGNGSYLCKYLDKARQKDVPDAFSNVGRFWGNSRGLVPVPVGVDFDQFQAAFPAVDETTGTVTDPVLITARWLGKWYERQIRKKYRKFRRNFRKMALSTGWTLIDGRGAFLRIERYFISRLERGLSYV